MEEDFQFLLCKRCGKEAQSPKLLACLHTLCMECLQESKPISQCPVCQFSFQDEVPFQDNLFFANLQAKLNTFQKIAGERDLVCHRCKGGAEFWCSECEEFLCSNCHDAHKWYLKQKSHESQRLVDLKNDTAQNFLKGVRKSSDLFCSEPSHSNQVVSIYCRGCCKPLCCSCALLDGEHYNAKLYCGIREETERRKEELSKIQAELAEKKRAYEQTYGSVRGRLQRLEKVCGETQELIQEKVEEMLQWVRRKGEQLLGKVDRQLRQEREGVQEALKHMERLVQRTASGEQLVEKVALFASDQEVMDMQPFIQKALDELRKEKLPATGIRVQAENFAEIKGELQALWERLTGKRDACTGSVAQAAAPGLNSDVPQDELSQSRLQKTLVLTPTYTLSLAQTPRGFVTSMTSPVKRPSSQTEKCIQASPKVMKLEGCDCEAGETSSRHSQKVTTDSRLRSAHESTPERESRCAVNVDEVVVNSPPEAQGSEVASSIVISSSEDTEEDLA
ncbi:protein PML [Elgaria multicarinata webbii]|uniref:protein PML n=1 Tax=Elgaria multicarinata webbii TaxID=159646 RepID=UPI002FCCC407